MELAGRVVVVTGAGAGIGAALARALAAAGARVVVSDRDGDAARAVAVEVGGVGEALDVSDGLAVESHVQHVESGIGPIALMVSNAGVLARDHGHAASATDSDWELSWRVNVMAHVHAARAALPAMMARREGWFLQVVSAAGLLTQIGAAAYATTKHAAIGFAESLAITHKDDGIGVSVLCPQAVDTAMAQSAPSMMGADVDGVLSPEAVAAAALAGLREQRFLILPHAGVAAYRQVKATDYDRWIGGMAKFRRGLLAG